MNRIIKLTVVAAALFGLAPIASARSVAVETSGEMFGCMHEGTKVRKTYIRHTDPVMLEEAVRIFDGNVAGKEYQVGTILQLVPNEAMVKHQKSAYPNSNG